MGKILNEVALEAGASREHNDAEMPGEEIANLLFCVVHAGCAEVNATGESSWHARGIQSSMLANAPIGLSPTVCCEYSLQTHFWYTENVCFLRG